MAIRFQVINTLGTLVGSTTLEPGIHKLKLSDSLIVAVEVLEHNKIKVDLANTKGDVHNLVFPCFINRPISDIDESTFLTKSMSELADNEIFLRYELGEDDVNFLVVRSDKDTVVGTKIKGERE